MNEPAIQTRELVRRFGQVAAIDSVELTIQAGGIVALVGPNGAGKSTFLNLLAGLLAPTSGTAEILGHPTRAMPASVAPLVQTVGDRHEPPPSVRLDALAALQSDAALSFDQQQFQQLLLDHQLSTTARFGSLSKGQRRWVLSALALASSPHVLLMDEPADGLDPAARRRLYDLLRQYVNDESATVLVSSHVLGDLERVADDVIVLHMGKILLHESLEKLRDELREITISYGEPAPEWLAHTQTLCEQSDGSMRRQWFRPGQNSPATLLNEADLHPAVRRVNLETLYLAITHGKSRVAADAVSVNEVQSCS